LLTLSVPSLRLSPFPHRIARRAWRRKCEGRRGS